MNKYSVFLLSLVVTLFSFCSSKKVHEVKDSPEGFLIKGSDTEFELVRNLFTSFNETDSLRFSIAGGGTEVGIKSLINNEISMAMASREMTGEEETLCVRQNIKVLPIMFATDAVAIITHPHLGVDSLTIDQVSDIFKGKIINWKQAGGPDRKITIYRRNMHSGTATYFKSKVTHGEVFGGAIVCENTKSITDNVSKDSTGIGYVGAGFLMDGDGKPSNKVWAMPLSIDNRHPAYSPYQTLEVKNGNYPLTRPLYQYYKLPIRNEVKNAIIFQLSLRGQEIIRTFGYFPINDYQKEINKIHGLDIKF